MADTHRPIVPRPMPVRRFAMEAGVALGAFTLLVFLGIFWRTVSLVETSARDQASSYIDLIVNARSWNARHGGVWVRKRPGVESNPYLRSLGVDPDTSTVSGMTLTLRNPAVMTNEMSLIAAETEGVQFRLTSLQLVNPSNAPDAWEREMLERFETDRTQVSRIEHPESGRILRMLRPVVTDESCLRCHGRQGYEVGNVRGAISLTLPLEAADRAIRADGLALIWVFLGVSVVGIGVGYQLVARMAEQVDNSERRLETLATTDPLTGIANRRAVLSRLEEELARAERAGHSVGVVELDADHFKNVNDRYGHAAGDTVLEHIAASIRTVLREYDTVGRLGGEEFLVIAPDIDASLLEILAERLRAAVEEAPISHGKHRIPMTVSAGATLSRSGDTTESAMLRADTALYAAKDAGRNRVEID